MTLTLRPITSCSSRAIGGASVNAVGLLLVVHRRPPSFRTVRRMSGPDSHAMTNGVSQTSVNSRSTTVACTAAVELDQPSENAPARTRPDHARRG